MTLDNGEDAYPPLPVSGTFEDIQIADHNFAQRERASKSWLTLQLSNRQHQDVTPLKRRKKFTKDCLRHKNNQTTSRKEKKRHSISVNVVEVGENAGSRQSSSHAIPKAFGTLLNLHSHTPVQPLTHSLSTELITVSNIDSGDASSKQHIYRWAKIYENQRGFVLFSIPFFSPQILFPWDPPPLSISDPLATNGTTRMNCKRHQPDVSAADYPLPDGNWRWVSREWMIDKQGGEAGRDGFEYNWFFRSKSWRGRPGWFGTGAWVRRRRWKRLMERPMLDAPQRDEGRRRVSVDGKEDVKLKSDFEDIWKGDEWDWPRAYDVMRRAESDRKRLAIWEEWLNGRQATSAMVDVVRTNIKDILPHFVYAAARMDLLRLFLQANILSESDLELEHPI